MLPNLIRYSGGFIKGVGGIGGGVTALFYATGFLSWKIGLIYLGIPEFEIVDVNYLITGARFFVALPLRFLLGLLQIGTWSWKLWALLILIPWIGWRAAREEQKQSRKWAFLVTAIPLLLLLLSITFVEFFSNLPAPGEPSALFNKGMDYAPPLDKISENFTNMVVFAVLAFTVTGLMYSWRRKIEEIDKERSAVPVSVTNLSSNTGRKPLAAVRRILGSMIPWSVLNNVILLLIAIGACVLFLLLPMNFIQNPLGKRYPVVRVYFDKAEVRLLFEIDSKFAGDLDEGVISAELRREFKERGLSLTPHASASIPSASQVLSLRNQVNDRVWLIKNPRLLFSIDSEFQSELESDPSLSIPLVKLLSNFGQINSEQIKRGIAKHAKTYELFGFIPRTVVETEIASTWLVTFEEGGWGYAKIERNKLNIYTSKQVPAPLRQEFAKRGISLSHQSKGTDGFFNQIVALLIKPKKEEGSLIYQMLKAERQWLITDKKNNRAYLVRKGGKKLCSIDAAFQSDLDSSRISAELRRELEKSGISLSQAVKAVTKVENCEWLIADERQAYTARKMEGKLNIYAETIFYDQYDELTYLVKKAKEKLEVYIYPEIQSAPSLLLLKKRKGDAGDLFLYSYEKRKMWQIKRNAVSRLVIIDYQSIWPAAYRSRAGRW